MTSAFIRAAAGWLPLRLRSRLAATWRRGRMNVGPGSWVHPGAQIIGRSHIVIGANSCVSDGCWLNVNDRRPGAAGIAIGSHCFIGRDNFLSSGLSIAIGDFCLTTIGCRFVSSSHVVVDPYRPVAATGTTASDAIVVGANCFFGSGVSVVGDVRIGHGCVIGAGAVVVGDLMPFSLAVGNPAHVVRRYSFSRRAWLRVTDAPTDAFDGQPDEGAYIARLRREPRLQIPWIAAGADMGSF